MGLFSSKITPSPEEHIQNEEKSAGNDMKLFMKMFVMSLHDFLRKFGGHRLPTIESHETYIKDESLKEYSFIPSDSNIIFISHENAGTDHSDPRGEQFGHVTKMVERLGRGDVARTDMDPFHSIFYNQTYVVFERWCSSFRHWCSSFRLSLHEEDLKMKLQS